MAFCDEAGILFYLGVLCILTVVLIPIMPNRANKKLVNSLNESQLDIYSGIKRERAKHALYGLCSGVLVSMLIVAYIKGFNKYEQIGLVLFIIVCMTEIVYMLLPKSKYLLNYLEKSQIKLWVASYNSWKTNTYLSFFILAIAMGLFVKMLCLTP